MKAQANEDLPDDEQAEKSDTPTEKFDPVKWKDEPPSQFKRFKNMDFTSEAMAEAAPRRRATDWYTNPMGKMLKAQAEATFKQNPMWTPSSLNFMQLESAYMKERVAEAAAAGENIFQATKRLSAEYQALQAKQRANRPFGSLEPTNFDKMLAMLQTRPHTVKPSPVMNVQYNSVTSGGLTAPEPIQTETKWNLNVSSNGYTSTAMKKTTPSVQAANVLAAAPKPKGSVNPLGTKKATNMKPAAPMAAATGFKSTRGAGFVFK
jgi:hypothetical protein